MLVVADSTPIHYLILIGEIHLLRELYGQVHVPDAVVRELSAENAPSEVKQWVGHMPSWATVIPAVDPSLLLFPFLGAGEREAIASLNRSKSGILLTDDMQARLAAEGLGIRVVPTIRVLSTASALSLVNFDDALSRLQKTNFRDSRKVIENLSRSLRAARKGEESAI